MTDLREAYLVTGVRTPIGRYGGALATVRPDDLAAHVIRALTERLPTVDWAAIDDVVLGCASQAGEDNRNVARMATLRLSSPAWFAQPRTTSSIAAQSTVGSRSVRARITCAARSSGRTVASAPPYRPIGVRTPVTR